MFATPAAIAVQNAQILAQTQRAAADLQAALTNRKVIDQAFGILRSRTGVTPNEAFARLRKQSQLEHLGVAAAANGIVEDAVRRARARRPHAD